MNNKTYHSNSQIGRQSILKQYHTESYHGRISDRNSSLANVSYIRGLYYSVHSRAPIEISLLFNMSLPANWERHESKTHPGAFYYFNSFGIAISVMM